MDTHPRAGINFERDLWSAGYRAIAGVDEAGRGALAGPVVAAAVILPPAADALAPLLGRVDDSKRLTPRQRAALYDVICRHALAWAVGRTEADAIDAEGIAAATRHAMLQALAALPCAPDYVLIDYLTLGAAVACPQRGIPHGDALSLSIAAASILAKVTRDRWMQAQDALFPCYGFAQHKGYGAAAHLRALAAFGPCPLHRRSFAPLKEQPLGTT